MRRHLAMCPHAKYGGYIRIYVPREKINIYPATFNRPFKELTGPSE